MNKKTIITILLALVAMMLVTIVLTRQENEVKSVEAMSKNAQEHKKVQDVAVLTYDISSLMNSASGYTIVIQEYVQKQMINEIEMDGFSMSKNISIGFSPIRTTDSIGTSGPSLPYCPIQMFSRICKFA